MKSTTATELKDSAVEIKTAPKTIEPVYTAAQLSDGYRTFGTTKAIVISALKLSGKDNFTLDEAKRFINAFKNKR